MRQFLSALLCATMIFFVFSNFSHDQHIPCSSIDGTQYRVRSEGQNLFVEHCDADGSLLKLIGNNFNGSYCCASAVAVQPDGNVVVAVVLEDAAEKTLAVVRYHDHSLRLDTSFGHHGIVLIEPVAQKNTIIPVVDVERDGTLVVVDASDETVIARIRADGTVLMPVDPTGDRKQANRAITRACPGPLVIEKVFCYGGCDSVIFGSRDGVRVVITRKGDQVVEESMCVQERDDVFSGSLTCEEFEALVSECSVCCDDGTVSDYQKFQQTWTALAELEAVLSEKFQQTWTVLAGLAPVIDQFGQAFTAIVQSTEIMTQKFNQTWTIIEALQTVTVEISTTVFTDLSLIYTAIAGSTSMITQEFQDTWTMLDALELTVDLSGTYTAIAAITALACEKFMQTWTIIEALRDHANSEFQQTWTAIDQVSENITADFQATWTLLDGVEETLSIKFDQLFADIQVVEDLIKIVTTSQLQQFVITTSILSVICNELLVGLQEVEDLLLSFTDIEQFLNEKFQQTWVNIAAIEAPITQELSEQTAFYEYQFQQLWQLIDTIENNLNVKFQQTWTALAALTACNSTPIIAPMTITDPGNYCLANDITGAIIIDASNVTLDLNGYQVSLIGGTVISVNSGKNNIVIKNGYVSGDASTISGITLGGNSAVTIENIAFSDTNSGIIMFSSQFVTVRDCTFENDLFGIDIAPTCAQVVMDNCAFSGAALIGIRGSSLSSFSITNSTFNANGSGIFMSSCTNGVINGCSMQSQTDPTSAGIYFDATGNSDIIIKNNIIAGGAGFGIASAGALSRVVISENMIGSHTGDNLLIAGGATDMQITNNIISGSTGRGIRFQSAACSRIAIENNEITSNVSGGIGVLSTAGLTNSTIKNNLIASNTTNGGILLQATSSNLTIDGNTMTANTTVGAIRATVAVNDIVISNNMISGNTGNGISFAAASRSILIENNQIADNTTNGIDATLGLNQSSIIGNQIVGNAAATQDNGINLLGSSTALCIENNCIGRHSQTGITAAVLTNSVIKGNEIDNNTSFGISITDGSSDVTLESNSITRNGSDGIDISGLSDMSKFLIANNAITGNSSNGISIVPAATFEKSTIRGNTVAGNTSTGISILPDIAQQLCVEENNVIGNSNGIITAASSSIFTNNQCLNNTGSGIATNVVATDCTYQGNICNNNGTTGIFNRGVNCVFDQNICNSNGTNGITLSSTADECTLSYNIFNNNAADGIQLENGCSDNNLVGNLCNKNTTTGINKITAVDNCSFTLNQCHRNGTNFSALVPATTIGTYVTATGVLTGKAATLGSEYTNLSIT